MKRIVCQKGLLNFILRYLNEQGLLRLMAFIKKLKWKEDLAFADVMRVITTRQEPKCNKYRKE